MTAMQAAQVAANSQFDTYLDATRSTATFSVPAAVERAAQRHILRRAANVRLLSVAAATLRTPCVQSTCGIAARLITDLSPPGPGRAFPYPPRSPANARYPVAAHPSIRRRLGPAHRAGPAARPGRPAQHVRRRPRRARSIVGG